MHNENDIHVDRRQPPMLTFADTGGQPFLSFLPDNGGWLLNVQHYRPFPMGAADFEAADEALSNAQRYLQGPLPDAALLETGRVKLLSDHRDGTTYYLTASLRQDGSLSVRGHDVGRASEYEYWYRIDAEDVPALAAALGGAPGEGILEVLAQRWSGEDAYRLGPAIRGSGVQYAFSNYW